MSYRLETRITPSGRVYQDYVFYGDPVETYGDTLESMLDNRPDYRPVVEYGLAGAAIGAAIGSLIDNIRAARKARKS
jgi:hypothetical protein